VSDAFAALGLPRRPYLAPVTVQERFRDLAARLHPDRCGGDPEPLARLNAARKTLLSNAARLSHLRELTFPAAPPRSLPSPDFELFSLLGSLGNNVETLVGKRAQSISSLTAALLHQEAAQLESSIAQASKKLGALHEEILAEIQRLDAMWPDTSSETLAEISNRAAYCERWTESLRQAGIRLAGG